MTEDSRDHAPDEGAPPPREPLPPPAFSPGSPRRKRYGHSGPEGGESGLMGGIPDDAFIDVEDGAEEEGYVPDDAFIHPDEIGTRDDPDISEDAFFDPDEPIVRTGPPATPEDYEAVLHGPSGTQDFEEDEVVVTGIDDDPHLPDRGVPGAREDAHFGRVVRAVGRLADDLRRAGETALRTGSHMSPLEVTLRAYCSGYLDGLREGRDD